MKLDNYLQSIYISYNDETIVVRDGVRMLGFDTHIEIKIEVVDFIRVRL